ncbi:M10 family metallopeptidase, partial [Magnetovibrio sp.]|uniref:M10 family metallopeptidase n=1 Tax=Magnetovibrio sp. TaxID=2024836 RepID=UPI002F94E285
MASTPNSSGSLTSVPINGSGNSAIDALTYAGGSINTKWGGAIGTGTTVTYSFPGSSGTSYWDTASYSYGTSGSEPYSMTYFNATQKAAFRTLANLYNEIANVNLTEVADNASVVGDIRIAFSNNLIGSGASGWTYAHAYTVGSSVTALPMHGDIWIEPSYNSSVPGSYSAHVVAHELGHALGLKHTFQGTTLPTAQDSTQYSLMSYTDYSAYGTYYPYTPQLYDVLTLQYLYGANMTTRTGNDAYTITSMSYNNSASAVVVRTIWDAGGSDTLSAADQTLAATINLNAGSFSSIGVKQGGGAALNNISIAFGASIENATGGSGNDTLIGNALNNILNGGAGSDAMNGGAGNDTYIVDNVGDTITDSAGTDTVESSISYTLSSTLEHLTLTGSAAINATGNASANTLTGNANNNILDGGAGSDTMNGGAGNDTYIVDNVGDTITDSAGIDTVQSSVSYTLATNLEYLTLTGTSAINATGNSLANTLTGNASNNVLDGGAGADTLRGGAGDDVYVVDSASDVVSENASEGTDEVQTALAYTLGTNLENLTLTGSAAVNGTGNTLNNVITGNAGNNTLNGGAGNDVMSGGAGDDTMMCDTAADQVDGGDGTDTADYSAVASGLSIDLLYSGSAVI